MATENVEAPTQEGVRVYIGNLSYSSTEETVKAHLATAGGNPTSIELPQKFGGRRPGGFAFAQYASEEEAKAVVEKLNETELEGRKVKLELARNKEDTDKHRAEVKERRDAGRAARDAAKAEKAAAAGDVTHTGDTTAVTDGEALVDGEKKQKRPSKKRAPRRRQPGEEGEEGTGAEATDGAAAVEGEAGETAAKPKRRNRKPKAATATEARIDGVEGEAQEAGAEKPKKERKPRAPRVRSEPTGELSKTQIFVANLPFDIDDAGLSAIFTNLSINVKSAKVAMRTRRFKPKTGEEAPKPVRSSRGYGFVEVSDAAQQKEAVEKVEGTLIGERTISAKVANEMKAVEKAGEEEVKQELEASA